ncbi:hypothetical protein [Archangium sp.]|uniref:hypothetical protein n=1 Tax=Archangium sp. TaxID=1872627 RepID=UPI002D2A1C7D|nr:hypothetical protein [Archangium sp.]HYO52061.1 hypothetical protein [Archangium sp.]
MGWPLRMFQGRRALLLRPSQEMNEVVGGVLARAFTFASNHFHLLVWARSRCWMTRRWWAGRATCWPME